MVMTCFFWFRLLEKVNAINNSKLLINDCIKTHWGTYITYIHKCKGILTQNMALAHIQHQSSWHWKCNRKRHKREALTEYEWLPFSKAGPPIDSLMVIYCERIRTQRVRWVLSQSIKAARLTFVWSTLMTFCFCVNIQYIASKKTVVCLCVLQHHFHAFNIGHICIYHRPQWDLWDTHRKRDILIHFFVTKDYFLIGSFLLPLIFSLITIRIVIIPAANEIW